MACIAIPTHIQSLLHKPSPLILSNSFPKHVRGTFPSFARRGGLTQLGISIPHFSARMRRKGKGKGGGVYASLFGVGAPEILVIGVVALLVFGPKGLAEAARSLGKTIRAFRPTLRELEEVSREFKSSLQREIGLDEIDNSVSNQSTRKPAYEESGTPMEPGSPSESVGAYTADEYLKVTEMQLKGALALAQKEQKEEKDRSQIQAQPQALSEDEPQEPSPPVTSPSKQEADK